MWLTDTHHDLIKTLVFVFRITKTILSIETTWLSLHALILSITLMQWYIILIR